MHDLVVGDIYMKMRFLSLFSRYELASGDIYEKL